MKKQMLTISILAFLSSSVLAQNLKFVRSGIITYRKTINMYAIIQRSITKKNEALFKPAFERYKQQYPQFKQLESTLMFCNNKTIFTPIANILSRVSFFNDPQISMQNNIAYTDLIARQFISKKKIFNNSYLLMDSLQNIKWKFTDEVRDIVGYVCRRANGIILDSVYVVAFYTDKIPVSGGPESFHGLPGMILQLALPHENVTWIATKVENVNLPVDSILPPKGGTIINYKGLIDKLKNSLKDNANKDSTDLKTFLL